MENENVQTLISELKRARKRRSWTQKQLGTMVGIDEKRISNVESGTTVPRLDLFCQLLDVLGYTIIIKKKQEKM